MSGPLILAAPIAAAAGAITFVSPCCLPLVPGYLAYATGMSGTDAQAAKTAPQAADRRPGAPGQAHAGTAAAAAADERETGDGGTRLAVDDRPADPPGASTLPAASRPAGRGRSGPPGRGRTIAGTMLFVLGFSALFAVYGAASGSLGGTLLAHHQGGVTAVLGSITIVLGLLFAGVFDRFSLAGRVVRPSVRPRAWPGRRCSG